MANLNNNCPECGPLNNGEHEAGIPVVSVPMDYMSRELGSLESQLSEAAGFPRTGGVAKIPSGRRFDAGSLATPREAGYRTSDNRIETTGATDGSVAFRRPVDRTPVRRAGQQFTLHETTAGDVAALVSNYPTLSEDEQPETGSEDTPDEPSEDSPDCDWEVICAIMQPIPAGLSDDAKDGGCEIVKAMVSRGDDVASMIGRGQPYRGVGCPPGLIMTIMGYTIIPSPVCKIYVTIRFSIGGGVSLIPEAGIVQQPAGGTGVAPTPAPPAQSYTCGTVAPEKPELGRITKRGQAFGEFLRSRRYIDWFTRQKNACEIRARNEGGTGVLQVYVIDSAGNKIHPHDAESHGDGMLAVCYWCRGSCPPGQNCNVVISADPEGGEVVQCRCE